MSLVGNLLKGAANFIKGGVKSLLSGKNESGQPSGYQLQQNTPTQAVTFPIQYIAIGVGVLLFILTLGFMFKSK